MCVNVWICPQKSHLQPFSNPSDGLFDQVYTEKSQTTSPQATEWNTNPAREQTEEYTDLTTLCAPDEQNEKQVETRHPCSPEESTTLLFSENSPLNPYRSQGSIKTPTMATNKQSNCVPVKQLEKPAPVTVYVTLNMFEQGQSR